MNSHVQDARYTAIDDLNFQYLDTPRLSVGDGIELYAESRGSGPAIVVLNNFFMVSPVWRSFTGRLAEDHRIVAYDFRGQGGSSAGVRTPTWDDHLADLDAVVDTLGGEQVYLLGTSMSAVICRDYALRHPAKVRGLVMAGPALSPWGNRRGRRIVKNWLEALRAHGMVGMFNQMYPLVFGDLMIENMGTAGYLGLRESLLMLHTQDQIEASFSLSLECDTDPELLRGLQVPVLLMTGDDDFGWSRSAVEAMHDLVPDLTTVEIARAGHLPFLEATAEFEDGVAQFVTAIEARFA
ncbi:alpha/beta fold hydrolase [Mycobacterium haemophilum]